MNRSRESKGDRPRVEDSYPIYNLTPLVAIALALGGWLAGLRRHRIEQAPRRISRASDAPGPKAHATCAARAGAAGAAAPAARDLDGAAYERRSQSW